MKHKAARCVIERARHPSVLPFEACALELGEHLLGDFVGQPGFAPALAAAAGALYSGGARLATGRQQAVLRRCAGFELLHICGGGAEGLDTAPLLADARFKLRCGSGREMAGAGGRFLLANRGCEGLVLDMGQTAIKILYRGQSFLFPRSFEKLPGSGMQPVEDPARYAQALRGFVSRAVKTAHEAPGRPALSCVVAGLPCELHDSLELEESSYPGMGGNCEFLLESFERAGVIPELLLVANDAELAALSVLSRRPVERRIVVLTLGLGVGGALVDI